MTVPNNAGNSNNRYSFGMQPQRPVTPRFSSLDPSLTLPGFYVLSEDEIRPGDVNMDGSIAFFPSKDLQKIYIRQWNKNGELERLTYVLANPVSESQNSQQMQPHPQSMPQQQVQMENTVAQALNNLNNGLSNTFAQFGAVLQNMNQRFDSMDQALSDLRQNNQPDDGGRG